MHCARSCTCTLQAWVGSRQERCIRWVFRTSLSFFFLGRIFFYLPVIWERVPSFWRVLLLRFVTHVTMLKTTTDTGFQNSRCICKYECSRWSHTGGLFCHPTDVRCETSIPICAVSRMVPTPSQFRVPATNTQPKM